MNRVHAMPMPIKLKKPVGRHTVAARSPSEIDCQCIVCNIHIKPGFYQYTCGRCNIVSCGGCTKRYILASIEGSPAVPCMGNNDGCPIIYDNTTIRAYTSKEGLEKVISHSVKKRMDIEHGLANQTDLQVGDMARRALELEVIIKDALETASELRSLAKKFRLKCKEYEVELAALEVAAPELEDMQKELDSLDKAQSKLCSYVKGHQATADECKEQLKAIKAAVYDTNIQLTGINVNCNKCNMALTKRPNEAIGDCTCGLSTCLDCYTVFKTGTIHTDCDPKAAKSMQLIKETTKPCPRCGMNYYKDENCNQVACEICHQVYNYETGEMIADTDWVHAPGAVELVGMEAVLAGQAAAVINDMRLDVPPQQPENNVVGMYQLIPPAQEQVCNDICMLSDAGVPHTENFITPLKQLVMDYTDVMNITSSNMARAIWKYNLKTATSASRRNSVHKTFYTYIKAQVLFSFIAEAVLGAVGPMMVKLRKVVHNRGDVYTSADKEKIQRIKIEIQNAMGYALAAFEQVPPYLVEFA